LSSPNVSSGTRIMIRWQTYPGLVKPDSLTRDELDDGNLDCPTVAHTVVCFPGCLPA
jgi:hypothetical protein